MPFVKVMYGLLIFMLKKSHRSQLLITTLNTVKLKGVSLHFS